MSPNSFVYPVKSLLSVKPPQPSSNLLGETDLHSDVPDPPVVTSVRFRHIQDEHGHHVATGIEGELKQCEDEVLWSVLLAGFDR